MSGPAIKPSARGPVAFALLVGGAATIAWMMLHWMSLTKVGDLIPIPKKTDPEVQLCDQAVDALLHSKDLVEVTRAGIIVHEIPCGIWKRL
jgi:hypothetical protein